MQEIIYPAPGSSKAASQGCTCPVLDNYYGKGYGGDWTVFGWAINLDCPVHGRLFHKCEEEKDGGH